MIEKVPDYRRKRERVVLSFDKNGIFVFREQLPDILKVAEGFFSRSGEPVFINELGTELLNGVSTSDPERMIGIKIFGLKNLRDWDIFWADVLELRRKA